MSSVYLDYNATTPVDSEVVDAISKSLIEDWGNPSSGHERGLIARKKIEIAREHLAKGIGASTSQIIFTSGGTEALNWAINSCCADEPDCHVVTSALEHCAVLNPLKKLASKSCQVDYVRPAKSRFAVTSDQIINHVNNKTKLVAVMLANNETGAIQPAEKIGEEILQLKKSGFQTQYLVDASQCYGKIPIDVEKIKCDYLVLAGHKFYGPRIGALYARDPSLLQPMLFGGGQERSLRPGTENTPMIVGLGEAARLVNEQLATYAAQMRHTRNILKEKLSALTPVTWLSEEPCLPNTLLVSLPEISSGKDFIESLNGQVLASTGAACHSGSVGSSVLNACGIDFHVQKRTIRFSTGRTTTEEQILRAVNLIAASLGRLQAQTQKFAD